jgi:hypothetical protein
VAQCQQKALVVRRNPSADCMGDPRWTSDLILSTWHQAATGHVPPAHLEYRHGASGGGFDKLRFNFECESLSEPRPSGSGRIDTGLDLNHRDDGRPQVHIDIPVYGGGMSFGSVSIHTILAKLARVCAACTGEGDIRAAPMRRVITQVHGLVVQNNPYVQYQKYAQG